MFRSKIRRVGTSFGILVPKRIIDELQAHEGDDIELAVVQPPNERRRRLEELAGTSPGLGPFRREARDPDRF